MNKNLIVALGSLCICSRINLIPGSVIIAWISGSFVAISLSCSGVNLDLTSLQLWRPS